MDQLSQPMTTFKMFAPTLVASRGDDGSMRIEGIASSTVRDHHGDQLSEKALRKMASSALGMTIFLNHEYRVPTDVFGTVEKAIVMKTADIDEKTGQPIFDLRFGIKVQKSNPIAVQTFEQIEGGTKLGLSIGAMVPEGGAVFTKQNGGTYLVDDVELVETSVVSLPANPRSWIDYAVKALAGAFSTDGEGKPTQRFLTKRLELLKALDDDTPTVPAATAEEEDETTTSEAADEATDEATDDAAGPAGEEVVVGEDGAEEVRLVHEAPMKGLSHEDLGLEKGKKVASHTHPHAHVHDGEHTHGYGDNQTVHSHPHAHVHSHDHGDDHDHQDTMNDYAHDHYHSGSMGDTEHAHDNTVTKDFDPELVKDQHPDLLKTKVSIWDGDKAIEIDTGRSKPKSDEDHSSQADGSGDEGGSTDSSGATKKSASDEVALTSVIDPGDSKAGETALVKALRGQLAGARADNDSLQKERDAAIELGQKILEGTRSIVHSLGSLPVGRKTRGGTFENPTVQTADERIDSLKAIYDDGVRAILKRR